MTGKELALLNLRETRRRSVLVWRAIPDSQLEWKPDPQAMSFGETIRHVWDGTYIYHQLLLEGKNLPDNFQSPFEHLPIGSVEEEITRAEPVFYAFLEDVAQLPEGDLGSRFIVRPEADPRQTRTVGDMLARFAYHDSVHTGQLLQMMRQAGLERPNIWD